MLKKTLIFILIAFLLLATYGYFGKQPEEISPDTMSAQLLRSGSFPVKVDRFDLVDTSRAIQANGDYAGAAQRMLEVLVWTPEVKPIEPKPLAVYSHGFMSIAKGGTYLAEHLAANGYTVVAANYPLTKFGAPGGPNPADVVNQPADVSFIIDKFLEFNQDSNSAYFGRIDAKRIAALGLSLGGLTTTLAAYHREMRDKRIKAAISIAGPSYLFSKRFFRTRTIPFMMIASPEDAIISYQENAVDITERVRNSTLVTVANASHAGFSDIAKWFRWFENPDSLACKQLLENPNLDTDASWGALLGTEKSGVLDIEMPALCAMQPLPKTVNPIRQHQITTIATVSFLNCQFEKNKIEAQRNCDFLHSRFADEIDEVSVTR